MGILADTLVSRGGYNRADALNAEKGPRASELAREFGVSLSGSTDQQSLNPGGGYETALRLVDQSYAPFQEAVQKQMAAVPQSFAQQQLQLEQSKTTLKQRYDNLLSEMKRRQGVEETQSLTNLAREYGRRGIPLSSGAYDVAQTEKLQPIREFYAGQTADIGLESETKQMEIANRILNLPTEQEKVLGELRMALAEKNAQRAEKAAQILMDIENRNEQIRQFNVTNARLSKESGSTASERERSRLTSLVQSAVKQGKTLNDIAVTFGDSGLTTADLLQAYNQSSPYGPAKEGPEELRRIFGNLSPAEKQSSQLNSSLEADVRTGQTLQSLAFKYGDTLSRNDIIGAYDRFSPYGKHKETPEQLALYFD